MQDSHSGGDVIAGNSPIKEIEDHLTGVHKELELFGVQQKYITEDIKWSDLQEPLRSAKQESDEAVELADKAADPD